MKSIFNKLFMFSLLVGLLDYCWIRFAPLEKHIPYIWPVVGFFIIATTVFHILSVNASKGKPQAFIRFYMGSTGLRLMLYSMVILIYCFYDKATLIPFAIGFMVHYLLFTVFDVYTQLKNSGK